MAKIADWLLNMSTNAKTMVDDSPQYRSLESQVQKRNITNAADNALGQLQTRVNSAMEQSIRDGAKAIEDITPYPVPLSGPEPFFPKEMQPPVQKVPGPEEFNSAPPTTPPPVDPFNSPTEAPPQEQLGQEQDVAGLVQRMAQITGLPPQQIATLAILGKEIERIEKENPPPTAPTASTPVPLSGPPSPGITNPPPVTSAPAPAATPAAPMAGASVPGMV